MSYGEHFDERRWHFEGEPETEPRPKQDCANGKADEPKEPPPDTIKGMRWVSLEGRDPPRREFVVGESWLARGVTTSHYAGGGLGKSWLAQKLGTCVAAGKPFLGLPTMKGPVLALFCEEDEGELWRRQQRVNADVGVYMRELAEFDASARFGDDNTLMVFPKGKPAEALPLLAEIERRALRTGAILIILDNAAQLFAGNEIDRAEVTAFLNALNGLARRTNAAVLLLGHPPKVEGVVYSGSTAWHSAVRCMWTMGPAPKGDDDEDDGGGALLLKRHKSNIGPKDAEIRLRWVDGALRRDEGDAPQSAMDRLYRRHEAKRVFLEGLDAFRAQQRAMSHSKQARDHYAPKFIRANGKGEGFSTLELERAMGELFDEGRIVARAKLWRGSNRNWVYGLARAGEAGGEPEAVQEAGRGDG